MRVCSHVAPTMNGTWAVLDLGATAQSVSAFQLVSGTVQSGSLSASSFGLESGLVSAVLGGTATLTKSTGGTVVLSGANDLRGLMEINAGSLVIANAGLLTRGALTVDGSGAVLDLGATAQSVSALRLSAGTVQSGSLTASSFGLESGLVSAVLGGAATLTEEHWWCGGVERCERPERVDGDQCWVAGDRGCWFAHTRSVDGGWDRSGAGSWCYGAERSAFRLAAGTVQSGSLTASSFGLESGLVVRGVGRDSDADQEYWRHGGVEWGERPERIDGG
jgi:autotransporter-associated beta strand protein